jgi:hypothetical protein
MTAVAAPTIDYLPRCLRDGAEKGAGRKRLHEADVESCRERFGTDFGIRQRRESDERDAVTNALLAADLTGENQTCAGAILISRKVYRH